MYNSINVLFFLSAILMYIDNPHILYSCEKPNHIFIVDQRVKDNRILG